MTTWYRYLLTNPDSGTRHIAVTHVPACRVGSRPIRPADVYSSKALQNRTLTVRVHRSALEFSRLIGQKVLINTSDYINTLINMVTAHPQGLVQQILCRNGFKTRA